MEKVTWEEMDTETQVDNANERIAYGVDELGGGHDGLYM